MKNSPPIAQKPRRKGPSFFYRMISGITRLWLKIFYGLRVYGHAHYIEGGALVAANHSSFLDPPVMGAVLSRGVHFLARETLFRPPWFGRILRTLQAHPLKRGRGDIETFRVVSTLLKEEKQVLLFPEGTRMGGGEFGAIKRGIALLALRNGKPILPVYIGGTEQVWGRERRFPRWTGQLVCVFGSPIDITQYLDLASGEKKQLGKKAVEEQICHDLKEAWEALRTWHQEGAKGTPP